MLSGFSLVNDYLLVFFSSGALISLGLFESALYPGMIYIIGSWCELFLHIEENLV